MGTSLTAPARLGVQLGLGALVLVLSSALLGALAHEFSSAAGLLALDTSLAEWLHRHARPELTAVLLVVTHLHGTGAVALYGLAVGTWLAARRRWRPFLLLGLGLGGVLILNALMKLAFARARPAFDEPLLTLATYSFPSGHVAGSTVAYGLVAIAVFGATRSQALRALAMLGAFAAIILVAFTRMYLGVHYLSDVLAGFAEGVAWLTICCMGLQAYWHRRDRRRARPAPGIGAQGEPE